MPEGIFILDDKESVLPADYRQTQMKPEIVGGVSSTIHMEQTSTTVRPSIFKTSVLPTQDGGSTVLKTVYGGTTSTIGGQYGGAAMAVSTGGSVMGVGGGVGDYAADVTYSTKPNDPLNVNVKKITTTTQYGGTGSIMGVGGGIGDAAADVTYSTKPMVRPAIV